MSSSNRRWGCRYGQATALIGLALLSGAVTLPGVAAQAQQEQSAKARRSDESNSANKKKHIYAKSIKNIELRGAPVTLTLPLMKQFTAKSLKECPPFLNVEGIEYNPNNSISYEIYINLPKGATPDPESPHYAGLLALYAYPSRGATFSTEISGVISELQQRNLISGDAISVTFVPPSKERTDRSGQIRFRRVTITGE